MRTYPLWLLLPLFVSGLHAAEPGLLFHLSGDAGTTADFSAANTPKPTYEAEIKPIADGARGGALECGDTQLLAYRAPGNIHAQRGTLSFFWRSRYPVGPTEFPIFRVGYADHSSWDMVWLRIDYNGHGFDAFVTDASLARTRVSASVDPFPGPKTWTHLAFAWDETQGVRLYINGRLAGRVDATARYDAALDQFGPHSRIISPYQVQSDYNFVRGGDIDEVRIYDRMLDEAAVVALAKGGDASSSASSVASTDANPFADAGIRAAWYFRYGFNRPNDPPPPLPVGRTAAIRKVEIHDAYDLKRWWWKANDGIRETTWPGVYNRSRLPGRNDYFQLPDWDCYVESGKSVTFTLPNEPWNHLEISGAAYGTIAVVEGTSSKTLFERAKAQEKTVHRLTAPRTGGKLQFTNVEAEMPIGEFAVYNVTDAHEPAGTIKQVFRLSSFGLAGDDSRSASGLSALSTFIHGRHPANETQILVAHPSDASPGPQLPQSPSPLPLVHVMIPNRWDSVTDGLDGLALDLKPLNLNPTHGDVIALNIRVKDPLWPLRDMLDFTFTVKPREAKTLWLDLRDRMLPPGKPLYLTVSSANPDFGCAALEGAELRLIFKAREAARAEHELDRFTQLRDSYAMLVEEHPNNPRLDLWNRFKGDLDDLLRVNPQHVLGRQYAAAAVPGSPRPPFQQPHPPAGVPLWAFRQVELLRYAQRFVMWYIDQRQVPYGDLGGGISDDTDLTNLWPGVALMGVEPEKLQRSLRALLEAAYRNGMFTRGLPTIQADELHSYEEGINCLAQNLLVDFGNPVLIERAMETARGVETVTGINPAGHRHFRSSYYSGTKVATEDPWGWTKPYSHLVLQVPQLLVDFNGAPAARTYLTEIADGLLAHRHAGANGRISTGTMIHFSTDREGRSTRGVFPWHVFWGPWKWTGDRRYLEPLFDGGAPSLMQVNASLLDQPDAKKAINASIASRDTPAGDLRPGGRVTNFRSSSADHFAWETSGDKSHLERLYAAQIENCAQLEYINTEGSLWIDRVGVPTAELQRARLGGIAVVRNALYPGHVVSWQFATPATAQSVAILVPGPTSSRLKVIAHNLESTPVRTSMTGWNIDPGTWELTQGIDTNNDDNADVDLATRSAPFERGTSLELILPPRATTVVTLQLKIPAPPYWQRPDLAITREDISLRDGTLHVRVHSIGGIAAPASTLVVRNSAGQTLATAPVPALEAPADLVPKTANVTLKLPASASVTGATVTLDPDHALSEITTRNNSVRL